MFIFGFHQFVCSCNFDILFSDFCKGRKISKSNFSTLQFFQKTNDSKRSQSNALSFYRSQNVFCWSKFFVSDKIGFCASTKDFEEALNAVKLLGWLKKFGPAQNILGPVKGQGISFQFFTSFSDLAF